MNPRPLILVVGGDALTERVCAELTATTGHEVRIVWPISARPDAALIAAGVAEAASLLALADAYRESQPAKARQIYEQVEKEFASSTTVTQAVKQQISSLTP